MTNAISGTTALGGMILLAHGVHDGHMAAQLLGASATVRSSVFGCVSYLLYRVSRVMGRG